MSKVHIHKHTHTHIQTYVCIHTCMHTPWHTQRHLRAAELKKKFWKKERFSKKLERTDTLTEVKMHDRCSWSFLWQRKLTDTNKLPKLHIVLSCSNKYGFISIQPSVHVWFALPHFWSHFCGQIAVNDGAEHIHVRIFRPLPGGGDLQLHSHQENKTAEEDIAYFWDVLGSFCVCAGFVSGWVFFFLWALGFTVH